MSLYMSVRNSKTVRNSKNSLFLFETERLGTWALQSPPPLNSILVLYLA